MAAFATMSLNDGQDTPVSHAFNPVDHGNGNYTWRESGTSSVLGAAIVHLTKLKVKGNSSLEKVRVKVFVPALETVTGQTYDGYTAQPRLAYALNSAQDFTMPIRASVAQRKDLVAFSKNVLTIDQVTDALFNSMFPT